MHTLKLPLTRAGLGRASDYLIPAIGLMAVAIRLLMYRRTPQSSSVLPPGTYRDPSTSCCPDRGP